VVKKSATGSTAKSVAAARLLDSMVQRRVRLIEASIQKSKTPMSARISRPSALLLFLSTLRRRFIAAMRFRLESSPPSACSGTWAVTLNVIGTMLALTLSVGIVKSTMRSCAEQPSMFHRGKNENQLAGRGRRNAGEIGLAVRRRRMSLERFFRAGRFMGGIVGRFMKSLGGSMAFAMSSLAW